MNKKLIWWNLNSEIYRNLVAFLTADKCRDLTTFLWDVVALQNLLVW